MRKERPRQRLATWWRFGVLLLVSLGCSSRSAPARAPLSARPVDFAYYTAEGERITGQSLRGRVTAIVFVTTFDSASQLEVSELQSIVRRHAPRINALVVVVEAPKYAPLLPVYSESLGLSIPVVIADYATRTGAGPFGDLRRVPTLVVVDAKGRPRWRKEGFVAAGEIERQLRSITGPRP